jgi:hypothetical protein
MKFPRFKCPHCNEGRLSFVKDALTVCTPQYIVTASKDPEWEHDWTVERFSAKLICDKTGCGEIVFVIGDTVTEQYYDEELNSWSYGEMLQPKSFFPAPPIIEIPENVPEKVRDEIKRATHLFWVDFNSSANRVRVSVENLLNHYDIVRTGIDKNGKEYKLDLNARIAVYEQTNPDHANTLTALRMIGNLGSHGVSVSREALLDSLRIYENALMELFGEHKAVMNELRQKLIATKGKY